jgi:ornithine--oxo-acid transaminase
MQHGVLSKDTHGTVVRLAPPLVITEQEINIAVAAFTAVLQEFDMAA